MPASSPRCARSRASGCSSSSRRLGVARGTVTARLEKLQAPRGGHRLRARPRPGRARLPGAGVRLPRDRPGPPRRGRRRPARRPRGARGAQRHRRPRPAVPRRRARQRPPPGRHQPHGRPPGRCGARRATSRCRARSPTATRRSCAPRARRAARAARRLSRRRRARRTVRAGGRRAARRAAARCSRCVRGSPRRARSSCSRAIGRQSSSTTAAGSPATSAASRSRCSAHSRRRVSRASAGSQVDDVHLAVVEQRVGVEVRRADRQPAVVDDPDLRVDVEAVDRAPRCAPQSVAARKRRGRRRASASARTRELAAGVLLAVVRARGQDDDDAEVVVSAGRGAWPRARRRPRAPRGTGSRGTRAARRSAARGRRPRGCGSRRRGTKSYWRSGSVRTTWTSTSPAGAGGRRAARRPARRVTSLQRPAKCAATSATAGPRRREVASCQPSRPRAGWAFVSYRSPPSSGQVDPADERDLVVDDHELLVVAVQRARARVARRADLRPARQLVARVARRGAVGGERVRRRARPHEHADVDALGRVGEQFAQDDGRLVAGERRSAA